MVNIEIKSNNDESGQELNLSEKWSTDIPILAATVWPNSYKAYFTLIFEIN